MGFLSAVGGRHLQRRGPTVRQPAAGNMFELDAIAACFIGGAAVTGGVGTVVGAMVGGLLVATMSNGMQLMGVDQSRPVGRQGPRAPAGGRLRRLQQAPRRRVPLTLRPVGPRRTTTRVVPRRKGGTRGDDADPPAGDGGRRGARRGVAPDGVPGDQRAPQRRAAHAGAGAGGDSRARLPAEPRGAGTGRPGQPARSGSRSSRSASTGRHRPCSGWNTPPPREPATRSPCRYSTTPPPAPARRRSSDSARSRSTPSWR